VGGGGPTVGVLAPWRATDVRACAKSTSCVGEKEARKGARERGQRMGQNELCEMRIRKD